MLTSFRAILTGTSTNLVEKTGDEGHRFQEQIEIAKKAFQVAYPYLPEKHTLFVETAFFPQRFDEYAFTTSQLTSAANNGMVDFTSWPFLFISSGSRFTVRETGLGIESAIALQDFANKDMFDFWTLNASGLFYKREITPDSDSNPAIISERGIVRHFAEAIVCMTRVYAELFDEDERVTLSVSFEGVRDRSLGAYNPTFRLPIRTGHVASRPVITVSASHNLADWRAGAVSLAVDLASNAIRHFGSKHVDQQAARIQIEKLFARQL